MNYIIGIDEAGRGPWAGPVVAGGFMCPVDFDFSVFAPHLTDSKQMSEKEREEVFGRIEKVMEADICRYHFAYRDASDIDILGIREANRQCMEEVILGLLQYVHPESGVQICIDGCDNYVFSGIECEYIFAKKARKNSPATQTFQHSNTQTFQHSNTQTFQHSNTLLQYTINGDAHVPAISAASVVAKVIRDRMMCDFHEDFPGYGFDTHKGYGTRKHQDALINYGITPIHRKSYAPVKTLISSTSSL